MATIITTIATARAWKQHTCCACGCVYRYVMERKATANGAAHTGAGMIATKKATQAILSGIDEHPCPGCGVVQPDMVGKSKAAWHLTFTLGTGLLLLLILLPAFGGQLPLDRAGEAAAAVAGFALLGHLMTVLCGPNWSLRGNVKESRNKMQTGELTVDDAGGEFNPRAVPVNVTIVHLLCLLGMLAAPLGFLAARFVSERYPMPRNEGVQPDVVGPGGTVRIPIQTSLRTYGGYWFAAATAKALNGNELGVTAPIQATTKTDRWGKITAVNDSRDPMEPIKPWVSVTIPDDESLGGQTVKLQIDMVITYPVPIKGKGLGGDSLKLKREVEVTVADPATDRLYRLAWQVGTGVGLAGCVLGGLVLTVMAQAMRWNTAAPRTYML